MRTVLCAFLVVTFAVLETRGQCLGALEPINPAAGGRKSLYTGQQGFSLALLDAINKLMPNDNLFFSPYSTYHALLIAYFIAGNQTEKFLKAALRLDDAQHKEEIHLAYKHDKYITKSNAQNASYEFTNANKIYVSDQVPVRDCIVDIFPDELEITKFKTDPEGARNHINNWVENQTKTMIKDLLPPGSIDDSTDLVLVNAAYFKGMWLKKFNPAETKPDIFYVSPSKQIMVDMMHVEGTFNYDVSEALGAHILELPYEGEEISMYILLPPFAKPDALENTLKKLNLKEFQNIVSGDRLFAHKVDVSLPKFALEHSIELVPILESLGVGNLFQAGADFSYLSKQKGISVDRGIHKARVVINENGAQAAAATALIGWRIMEDEEEKIKFTCNKPFLFLIYNKKQNTILFLGVYRKPNGS